jgi:hypothetical protein
MDAANTSTVDTGPIASSVPAPAQPHGPSVHDVLANIDVAGFDWGAYEGSYTGNTLIVTSERH